MSYHRASDHPRSFRIPPPSPPSHSSDTSSSGWSTPELLEFEHDSPANEPPPLDTIIHSLDERLRTLDRRRSVIKGPRSPRVPAAALSPAPLPSAPACFEKLSDVAQALVTYQNSLSTPTLVSSASSRHQLRFAVESLLELAIGISETSLQPSTILEACLRDEREEVELATTNEAEDPPRAPAPARSTVGTSTEPTKDIINTRLEALEQLMTAQQAEMAAKMARLETQQDEQARKTVDALVKQYFKDNDQQRSTDEALWKLERSLESQRATMVASVARLEARLDEEVPTPFRPSTSWSPNEFRSAMKVELEAQGIL